MPSTNAVVGYCVKCKQKREVAGGAPVRQKNGSIAHANGKCVKCETKMHVMLPNPKTKAKA